MSKIRHETCVNLFHIQSNKVNAKVSFGQKPLNEQNVVELNFVY